AEVTVLQEEAPEAPVADPQLTVTPNKDLDPEVENTLTVEGEGYVGEAASQGVYVVIGDRTIWSGEGGLVQDGWLAIEWVQPNEISEGWFRVEMEVKARGRDSEVDSHVATSAAHDRSQTARSMDSFVAVTVLEETEPEPEPEPE